MKVPNTEKLIQQINALNACQYPWSIGSRRSGFAIDVWPNVDHSDVAEESIREYGIHHDECLADTIEAALSKAKSVTMNTKGKTLCWLSNRPTETSKFIGLSWNAGPPESIRMTTDCGAICRMFPKQATQIEIRRCSNLIGLSWDQARKEEPSLFESS